MPSFGHVQAAWISSKSLCLLLPFARASQFSAQYFQKPVKQPIVYLSQGLDASSVSQQGTDKVVSKDTIWN